MKTTDTHIFFYGSVFSQWADSLFEIDGIQYATAEQWMMAEKARTFNDEETLQKILFYPSPAVQKKLGRQVKNYNDEVWASKRFDAVVKGNYAKFSQNERLKKILLDTGNKILVEASPTDRIWGIGLSEYDIRCTDESKWRGQNLLGKALMEVRDMLRKEEKNV